MTYSQENCKKYFTAIFNTIVLVSAIFSIVSSYITIKQLPVIKNQLTEISAQPKIQIDFSKTESNKWKDNAYTNTAGLFVRNIGNKVTSYWRAAVYFCKNVEIVDYDHRWMREGDNLFVYESNKPVPPDFQNTFQVYSLNLDNVGYFRFALSDKNNAENITPISQIVVSGDYPNPTNYLVMLASTSVYTYTNIVKDISTTSQKENQTNLQDCF